jgi:hypothetical protein
MLFRYAFLSGRRLTMPRGDGHAIHRPAKPRKPRSGNWPQQEFDAFGSPKINADCLAFAPPALSSVCLARAVNASGDFKQKSSGRNRTGSIENV